MIGHLVLGHVPFGGVLGGSPLSGWTEQPSDNQNGWGEQLRGPNQWDNESASGGMWLQQPVNEIDTIKRASD